MAACRPPKNESLFGNDESIEPFPHVFTKYEKEGVSFNYPATWNVQEDRTLDEGIRMLVIKSSVAGVQILLVRAGSVLSLDSFAQCMTGSKQVLKEGTVGETRIIQVRRNASGGRLLHGIRHNFPLTSAGKTTFYSRDCFESTTERMKVLITICAPDTQWDASDSGFQVVFDSLRF